MKLFLSTPCYGGMCLDKYAVGVLKLHQALSMKGWGFLYDTIENESLVHRARNVAVARFLQTDATHFMFIDSDIDFAPEGVVRLMESGHDVAVACYPKKVVMWEQVQEGIKNNPDKHNPPPIMASSLVTNFGESRVIQVDKGFCEVLDGPTGFMCIKREVFEKITEKFPELWCKNDHMNKDFDEYCAVFDCMIDPVTRRYLSEDYAFCRRWQMCGGKIYADIFNVLGHIGNLPFNSNMVHRLRDKEP